jgi:hypothetical protein
MRRDVSGSLPQTEWPGAPPHQRSAPVHPKKHGQQRMGISGWRETEESACKGGEIPRW